MDRDNDIKEVIQEIDENISELILQKEILQNLDFSKPVDEETWHKLCETPLRNSDLLGVLVKNIFPLAEDIKVHCNYVYFNLLGFKVQIPTSSCYSINIDTSWYCCSYWKEPKLVYDPIIDEITKYFEAVNNHKGWYECAKNRIRSGESYRKWVLFLMWFGKYKWKPITSRHKQAYENRKRENEEEYKRNLEKYRKEFKETQERVDLLFNELIPMLDKFSTKHFSYNDQGWNSVSLEKIKKNEELIRSNTDGKNYSST